MRRRHQHLWAWSLWARGIQFAELAEAASTGLSSRDFNKLVASLFLIDVILRFDSKTHKDQMLKLIQGFDNLVATMEGFSVEELHEKLRTTLAKIRTDVSMPPPPPPTTPRQTKRKTPATPGTPAVPSPTGDSVSVIAATRKQ